MAKRMTGTKTAKGNKVSAAPLDNELKTRIRRAALKVFSENGYGSASIPAIAREAGVSVGAIYNYYDSKDALRRSVVRHYQRIPVISKVLENPPDKGTSAFLHSLFDSMLNLDLKDAGYAIFLYDEIKRDLKFRSNYVKENVTPFRKYVDRYLEKAIKRGEINNIDPTIASTLFGILFMGMTLNLVVEKEQSPLYKMPREKLLNTLVEFMLFGLAGQRKTEHPIH